MKLAPRLTGAAAALCLVPALALAQRTAAPGAPAAPSAPAAPIVEGPLKHAPQPTKPAITSADLMTRLYIFADDSMLGRESGALGNVKGTDYIARELARLGLEPAGEKGTYFQTIPLVRRGLDPKASLVLDGAALAKGTEFLPLAPGPYTPFGSTRSLDGVQVVYGGRLGDPTVTLTPEQVKGKLVVFDAPRAPGGSRAFQFWVFAGQLARLTDAAAIAIATLDISPEGVTGYFAGEQLLMSDGAAPAADGRPVGMLVSTAVAQRLLGASMEGMQAGTAGKTVGGSIAFSDRPTEYPARNVVAILRGSDAKLKGQFVAIGAHNDHDGTMDSPVDHDSVRVVNRFLRPGGAESNPHPPTAEQRAQILAALDSVRKLRPARADSVMNGADDDGTGSMGVLEIAEQMATSKVKPKRSILFVWHTAEEKGLYGSEYFTDHPTVPRDSIVAQINIDMIGRGGPHDEVPNGGPSYLQLIGSRRLSTQLGDLVERRNTDGKFGFTFDYQFDANGHPAQYYCRSDHYNYARYGIPVVFLSTGGHQDYHMPTDEPQYIDFAHYERVTSFVGDLAWTVANLDQRPVVDKPKPDPHGECRQ